MMPIGWRQSLTSIAIALFVCVASSGTVLAQQSTDASLGDPSTQSIAAIVNDDVISDYDLNQRMKLVLAIANIPANEQTLPRVRAQVLRTLIDERLKLQEARRFELTVDQAELNQAYDDVARRAGLTPTQLDEFLKDNGIDKSTISQQVAADILWRQLIQGAFGSRVTVSDDQIDAEMDRLGKEGAQPQYEVSEIFLPTGGAASPQMREAATQIVGEIQRGAPFGAVASQFSQAPSAAVGGDIGWVRASQLPEPVAAVVTGLSPGQVAGPIETRNGFYIVQLRQVRKSITKTDPMDEQYSFIHVTVPVSESAPESEVDEALAEAERISLNFNACSTLPTLIKNYAPTATSERHAMTAREMDKTLLDAVSDLQPGEAADPVRSPIGIEVIALCGRQQPPGGMPTRTEVDNAIFAEQVSMMARRHLRDLRRDAVVEVR